MDFRDVLDAPLADILAMVRGGRRRVRTEDVATPSDQHSRNQRLSPRALVGLARERVQAARESTGLSTQELGFALDDIPVTYPSAQRESAPFAGLPIPIKDLLPVRGFPAPRVRPIACLCRTRTTPWRTRYWTPAPPFWEHQPPLNWAYRAIRNRPICQRLLTRPCPVTRQVAHREGRQRWLLAASSRWRMGATAAARSASLLPVAGSSVLSLPTIPPMGSFARMVFSRARSRMSRYRRR